LLKESKKIHYLVEQWSLLKPQQWKCDGNKRGRGKMGEEDGLVKGKVGWGKEG